MDDFTNIMSNWQLAAQKQADHARSQLSVLREQLRIAGVSELRIAYDGAGDSGSIDEINGTPDHAWQALRTEPFAGTNETVQQVVESVAYNLLEERHPGWEINDGSFGEIVITPNGSQLEHNHRVTHTEYEETELD